jgi:hypothetical protein
MNGGFMRTFLQYLILGLVFVPTLMLLVDAKTQRSADSGGLNRNVTSDCEIRDDDQRVSQDQITQVYRSF